MPNLFHQTRHSPKELLECKQPNLKTYIDDTYILILKEKEVELEQTIKKAMEKVSTYTEANKLHLNSSKTQIMILTKDREKRKQFEIELGEKTVKHSMNVNILGINLSQDLTWDQHVTKNVIPQLRNRVRTLRLVSKYMDNNFKKRYANSLFKSKLMYGMEQWGGAPKSILKNVQNLQDQVTRLTLPREYKEKSLRQRLQKMDWISVQKEVKRATYVQTYKILNQGVPQEMAIKMPMNEKSLRIKEHQKLGTKPRWLGKTKITRATYRNRAYEYNTLPKVVTTQPDLRKFKKELNKWMKKNPL